MEGFRTSRALVIDDIPAEAIPVIQALGSMGIASIYHDASPDAVYSKKHTGMRLLFLDMVLTNRSASESDPEGAANALTGALGQLIELSNEPVVAVCWTRHPDFKEDFQKAFSRVFQILLWHVFSPSRKKISPILRSNRNWCHRSSKLWKR